MKVIIRDLRPDDSKISWNWRNDPLVWIFTGRKWNNLVTEEIEKKWIESVIQIKNEKRYAICVGNNEQYIGNVQLTNITKEDAIFHIFIGNTEFWGKGIAKKATKIILDFAFNNIKLQRIKLRVRLNHKVAINLYKNIGFKETSIDSELIYMELLKIHYNTK